MKISFFNLLVFTYTLFHFVSNSKCYGQNLVPNGNFETFSVCPTANGQLNYATPWNSARGTCDYYNTCNSGPFDIPTNQVGYQQAHSGNGYAGFFAAQGYFETREYLQVQLSEPLEAGVEYCVEYYICFADKLNQFNELTYDMAVNNIGCFLSPTNYAPQPSNFNHIAVTPQIINNPTLQLLADTSNWLIVEGQFIAAGGEQYLLIGSFNDNSGQDTTALDFWQSNLWSYYLVDDVKLTNCSCPPIYSNAVITSLSCNDDNSASITSIGSGGTAPYSYILNLNGNTEGSYPSTSDTVSFTDLGPGNYTLQITDANLCATDTVIIISSPIGLTLNATLVNASCEQNNGSISLSVNGGSGVYVYNWGTSTSSGSSLNNIPAGNYPIQITDDNGCFLDTAFTISTTLNPNASFIMNPSLLVDYSTAISFTDNSTANSGTITSYNWSISNGIQSNTPQISVVFGVAGIYEILYVVSNSVGCFDTLYTTIILEGELTIPNVITANSDGTNDIFYLTGLQNFKQVSVTVQNRWGNIVYTDDNYKNDWKPEELNDGVYFYLIEVQSQSGKNEIFHGFIEIIN